ncbi:hypothetical protein KOI35_28780 [Actinoplanes bogorensis]|uniref:Uncharacterized protein n=1 Tax=Paractinoplanes bogorensis TaxID=1610840 RepID=A0ABS5YZH8_9ACTN|nr:hypothetical protein [Actinoplanes bogorensis]MBU2667515.1 hypothetical protein [Actinoplanes bogorensis]
MQIDTLRSGWPEQILSGRYSFRTRRRDDLEEIFDNLIREISFDVADQRTEKQLHLRIGGRSVMAVLQHTGGFWPHMPRGPKVYHLDPPGPLLTLIQHDRPTRPMNPPSGLLGLVDRAAAVRTRSDWREVVSWTRSADVLDNRLDMVIGRIERTDGVFERSHTQIYDPSGRLVGLMRESVASTVRGWLPMNTRLEAKRLTFTVDGRPVARIRQRFHFWYDEFEFDVSRLAGRLDPRLVLACGVQQLAHYSTW